MDNFFSEKFKQNNNYNGIMFSSNYLLDHYSKLVAQHPDLMRSFPLPYDPLLHHDMMGLNTLSNSPVTPSVTSSVSASESESTSSSSRRSSFDFAHSPLKELEKEVTPSSLIESVIETATNSPRRLSTEPEASSSRNLEIAEVNLNAMPIPKHEIECDIEIFLVHHIKDYLKKTNTDLRGDLHMEFDFYRYIESMNAELYPSSGRGKRKPRTKSDASTSSASTSSASSSPASTSPASTSSASTSPVSTSSASTPSASTSSASTSPASTSSASTSPASTSSASTSSASTSSASTSPASTLSASTSPASTSSPSTSSASTSFASTSSASSARKPEKSADSDSPQGNSSKRFKADSDQKKEVHKEVNIFEGIPSFAVALRADRLKQIEQTNEKAKIDVSFVKMPLDSPMIRTFPGADDRPKKEVDRRKKNSEAAFKSRAKNKIFAHKLEEEAFEAMRENFELKRKVAFLRAQVNFTLRKHGKKEVNFNELFENKIDQVLKIQPKQSPLALTQPE